MSRSYYKNLVWGTSKDYKCSERNKPIRCKCRQVLHECIDFDTLEFPHKYTMLDPWDVQDVKVFNGINKEHKNWFKCVKMKRNQDVAA